MWCGVGWEHAMLGSEQLRPGKCAITELGTDVDLCGWKRVSHLWDSIGWEHAMLGAEH